MLAQMDEAPCPACRRGARSLESRPRRRASVGLRERMRLSGRAMTALFIGARDRALEVNGRESEGKRGQAARNSGEFGDGEFGDTIHNSLAFSCFSE